MKQDQLEMVMFDSDKCEEYVSMPCAMKMQIFCYSDVEDELSMTMMIMLLMMIAHAYVGSLSKLGCLVTRAIADQTDTQMALA